jgi:hypothetical protein
MEVKPMTDREAEKEAIKKYGSVEAWRKTYANVAENDPSDVDYRLMSHTIEYELKKNYNGDAAALFRDRPDLYAQYRKDVSIRVGVKVKD